MSEQDPAMEGPPADPADGGIRPPDFRLPPDTRLGPVALQVASLRRSIDYYSAVLGLQRVDAEGERVRLAAADGVVLLELQERPWAEPVPRRGRLGLYHFALLLPDRPSLGSFLAHLASLGVRPGMSDHGVSEAIYLTDPDGLGIEIYADRPRAQWSYSGRELQMTTEPLDVKSVLAQAGASWQGMPAGATVGHVHLFVGDLEQASAFYHRAMGFDRMVWSYPGALFLAAGGYHHHLGTNTWAAGAAPAGPDDARLLEWRVVLADAEAVQAAGHSVEAAGYAVEWGEGEWAAVDPWGTRVRVRTCGGGKVKR